MGEKRSLQRCGRPRCSCCGLSRRKGICSGRSPHTRRSCASLSRLLRSPRLPSNRHPVVTESRACLRRRVQREFEVIWARKRFVVECEWRPRTTDVNGILELAPVVAHLKQDPHIASHCPVFCKPLVGFCDYITAPCSTICINFWHWPNMFQDVSNTVSNLSAEIIKD